MPDELELKIVSLQKQIDELNEKIAKNDFSNTQIVYKEIVQKAGGNQSDNFATGVSGWRLDSNGNLEANNGNFRGDITGCSGIFTGYISASGGTIGGFAIGSDYIRDAGNSFGLVSTITGGDDIRFWAGATYANRASAPLRLTEGGNGYFSGDIYVSNLNMTGGTFINTAATLAEARLNVLFKKTIAVGSFGDGFTETPGTGGTITRNYSNTILATTQASQVCRISSPGIGGGSFTIDSEFICQISLDQTTSQATFWGVGNASPDATGADVSHHYGFIVVNATLYASTGDGATQTRTDVSSGITLTNYNNYRTVFTAGTNVKFYVNDVLVATHTTNLPTTTAGAIYISIQETAAGGRNLNVKNNYTFIHDIV